MISDISKHSCVILYLFSFSCFFDRAECACGVLIHVNTVNTTRIGNGL